MKYRIQLRKVELAILATEWRIQAATLVNGETTWDDVVWSNAAQNYVFLPCGEEAEPKAALSEAIFELMILTKDWVTVVEHGKSTDVFDIP